MQKSPEHGKKPGSSKDPKGLQAQPSSYSVTEVYGTDGTLKDMASLADLNHDLFASL